MQEGDPIGVALVAARRAAGLSQAELGARLGVRQQQVARWEAAAYAVASLERVEQVAAALGVGLEARGACIAMESRTPYGVNRKAASTPAERALARAGIDVDVLAAFARSHGIERIDVFGSVLRDDFGPESDLDMLVTYAHGRTPSLLGAADLETELVALAGRPVDLVSRPAVERDSNEPRRAAILSEACTVYAA